MILVLVIGLWTFLRALLFGSAAIALENVALRHQLAVLQRSVNRPRLARWDRVLWVWLSRLWTQWRPSLVIVQPATVLEARDRASGGRLREPRISNASRAGSLGGATRGQWRVAR
jgi:hypothetical protein